MPSIIPIVEGDGDVIAVPILLRHILKEMQQWGWSVGRPKLDGDLIALRRNIDRFLQLAQLEQDCGGIIILLDLDDGCPRNEAHKLAVQVRALRLACPVAIVFAHREYEAWLLASLDTLAGHYGLPQNLVYPGHVEGIRGAKEWLGKNMPSDAKYKETQHQVKFTSLIDLDLARHNSRSFRRLCHAVEELILNASAQQQGHVTP